MQYNIVQYSRVHKINVIIVLTKLLYNIYFCTIIAMAMQLLLLYNSTAINTIVPQLLLLSNIYFI